MVEALTAKIQNWENERGVDFMYNGVSNMLFLQKMYHPRHEVIWKCFPWLLKFLVLVRTYNIGGEKIEAGVGEEI